ncbi:hypothetical protein [Lactobacillus intestinalis]|uniref:Uncharacterized protein n=1 Tax=Lactobacillus intestinalis DSM 6629 TaxID=1423761 RepID=A0ABR5PPU4_9LACO|nr:hypothetical protein [Lactobacillus intestinalis]KRM32430.1 hypothetical protein FC44_GL001852 [Lactobacillus intestinalis DSM 6629]UTW39795.1 hypothetical protein KBW87_05000 [Lactobacillus intestinalis]
MKLKNIIAISATSVALSGAALVSPQIQNQNLMQATTVEAAKLTQGQVNTQKADAQVMKAVKAKVNHKSKRTINKYVKNATLAVNRIKNKTSEPVSVGQTKTALVKILNTVNHPDSKHLNASKTAINKISSKSTRNSMNKRYLSQLNKFVKVSKAKTAKVNTTSSVKTAKTYTNNPLDRPVTDEKDRLTIEASNLAYSDKHKSDEISNKLSNYTGSYISDIVNGKYSWNDIPGNNNIEKIYKLANHIGLKLSYVNYYPSEKQLDQLAKKQFTTKKQKIWSKVYKKYAPYTWADVIISNNAHTAKEEWPSDNFLSGLDNTKKAKSEYQRLAWTKYQKQQAAKEKAFRQERDKEWKAQHEAQ